MPDEVTGDDEVEALAGETLRERVIAPYGVERHDVVERYGGIVSILGTQEGNVRMVDELDAGNR